MMWNIDDPESFPGELFLYAALFFGELRRRVMQWQIEPNTSSVEKYRQFFREHLWKKEVSDSDREAFVVVMDKVYKWVKSNSEKSIRILSLPPYCVAEWVQGNGELVQIMEGMKNSISLHVLSCILMVLFSCQSIFGDDEGQMESLPKEEFSVEIKMEISAICRAYSEVKFALCIP